MVAGTLAEAGYHMGENLHPPRDSNPKGFLEDAEVNDVNNELLGPLVPKRRWFMNRWFMRLPWVGPRRGRSERWLAHVAPGTPIPAPSPGTRERIARFTRRTPFCYKDPRFCYTLPVWRPFLHDTVFVCVFRHPAATAASIVKEVRRHLHGLAVDVEEALEIQRLMYRHVLDVHRHDGRWLFLHYDQVLAGLGLDRLEAFTGASVDRSFPDPSLRRSEPTHPLPEASADLYRTLCDLAGYAP